MKARSHAGGKSRIMGIFGETMVRTTGLIFAVLALGLLLAGCDRCGDWYSPFENPFKSSPHACRDGAGQPSH
jgi:hypothetical protein